ncbi:MAG: HD domain-containing protein [Rhodocyclales bacterium]|nr:HD domain-containing protein [Rhodocyclales bacterium]
MKPIALDPFTGNQGSDFTAARELVGAIVAAIAPQHDGGRIACAFDLVDAACAGRLANYQQLKTLYHSYMHTLEVTLCAARLAHGLHLAGTDLGADGLDATIVAALLHDMGYLKRDEEGDGSGAQFTVDHVERGAAFARTHLARESAAFVDAVTKAILITDHRLATDRLEFSSAQAQLAAQIVGTADLVAQMASRDYLERLLFLYFEFGEAGLGNYRDFEDILERTAGFYRLMRERLDGQLQDMVPYLAGHFEATQGVSCNLYQASIDRNLAYLEQVLAAEHGERVSLLKRRETVERVLHTLPAE